MSCLLFGVVAAFQRPLRQGANNRNPLYDYTILVIVGGVSLRKRVLLGSSLTGRAVLLFFYTFTGKRRWYCTEMNILSFRLLSQGLSQVR
jgi:hypothetical protein